MKKVLGIFVILTVLALFAGCRTYDLTTNKVGWSNYADVSVKDFDVCGIVNLESQVVYEFGPLGFKKSYKGSVIVWSDLMAEAAKLGADDVINVRIEETNYNYRITSSGWFEEENKRIYNPGFIEFFTGYSTTWKYKATALAIKYTDPIDRQKSDRVDNIKGQDKKGQDKK